MMKRLAAISAFLALVASPAWAGQLTLTMADGRVTLVADNVTVRQILAEWSRVGQTKIVNAERLFGPPINLRLEDVPEEYALEAILRSASGYLAAPRAVPQADASRFDRILILPTSLAPPQLPAPSPAAGLRNASPALQRALPQPTPLESSQEPETEPEGNPPGGMAQPGDEDASTTDSGVRQFPGATVTSPFPGQIVQPPSTDGTKVTAPGTSVIRPPQTQPKRPPQDPGA